MSNPVFLFVDDCKLESLAVSFKRATALKFDGLVINTKSQNLRNVEYIQQVRAYSAEYNMQIILHIDDTSSVGLVDLEAAHFAERVELFINQAFRLGAGVLIIRPGKETVKYSRQEILKRLKNASSIKRMKNVADKIIKNDASLSLTMQRKSL